ncbi:MAG: hypothetical protein INQ03_03315 [Candidatus Heimdallarchaeota archaeon]|nr:hypothetical protein [Candidatus Heimdallarchaeota archaeon]
MATSISSVKMDFSSFIEYKIPNVKLNLILREQKEAFLEAKNGEAFTFPKEYAGLIPMGNPPAYFGGYFIDKGQLYMSVFRSVDTAVHLSASGDARKAKNPTTILANIEHQLTEFLNSSTNKQNEVELNISLDHVKPNKDLLKEYNDLDSIVYSIFTRNKIALIGKYTDAIAFVMAILEYIPDEFKTLMGFTFNVPYIDNRSIVFAGIDNISGFDFEGELMHYEMNEAAVVDLEKKEAYGNYSSTSTRKIAELMKSGGDLSEIHKIVAQIVDMANKSLDCTDPTDFANKYSFEYDDADLIFTMKEVGQELGGN